MTKIKLLLVEDERTLASIIKDTLSEKGFDVILAYDGKAGLKSAQEAIPDVIVTDIMMPTMDGFSFVKELKKKKSLADIPVIFLSARSQTEDIVEGFEIGANDYLRKPFAMSELIVRVRALLRYRKPELLGGSEDSSKEISSYEIGIYTFDVKRQTLSVGSKTEQLSGREADVLLYLCRTRGEVVPNAKMLLELWGDDSYFNTRSLNVFITRLRGDRKSVV